MQQNILHSDLYQSRVPVMMRGDKKGLNYLEWYAPGDAACLG